MNVEWGDQKRWLLFWGLVAKGIAFSDELPFQPGGMILKWVANIVWMAFDGAFLYLLKPPAEQPPADEA
jgi:hypothetical protein